jgi:malate dehydrogenase (oxaloacetate-decarboxylating)
MPSPSVSFSVSLRVELDHSPGSLGRLTTTIGEAGGNILGVDMVEVAGGRMVRDVSILAADTANNRRRRAIVDQFCALTAQATERIVEQARRAEAEN